MNHTLLIMTEVMNDAVLKLPEFLKNMRQVTWKPVKDSYIQVSTDNEFPCHYWRKEESTLKRKKVYDWTMQ